MSKHTPGPWEVSPRDQMRVNVKTGTRLHPSEARHATPEEIEELGDACHDDFNICQCDDEFYMRPPKECEANARLIAAAPDLLAACEAALSILRAYILPDHFDGHASRALIMVRDAITKAKEES